MSEQIYRYIIIGGGLAGASASEGIREHDENGSILIIGNEKHIPYNRPPLSKKLWFGQKKVEDIVVQDHDYYSRHRITLALNAEVIGIQPDARVVTDSRGNTYRYEKLLIATGGKPKRLNIPGADLDDIYYYRYLDDYLNLRTRAKERESALVIGGGFIGSEMAAALNINKVDVTLLFPDSYLVSRVFPEELGRAITDEYTKRGVRIIAGDLPQSIERRNGKFLTRTRNGEEIESGIIVAGVGITPSIELAEAAGLKTDNGITVNEYLQTSDENIYAAGDNANFPYMVLGEHRRVEHWDNALNQGTFAGRNMAGLNQPYDYMPYFFSDLFEFGYEAVGDVDSRLETFADWQKENDTGVIYYLKDNKVRGAMMCNVWDKVDDARELIKKGSKVTPDSLKGAIK